MEKEKKGELIKEERVIADEVADTILSHNDNEKRKFLVLLLIFIVCLTFLVSSISFAIISSYHSGSHNNIIESGSVLFSFSENSNYIEIHDAYPVSDYVGKSYTGHNQYLDFSVSVGFSKKVKNKNLQYEISLIPLSGNTLDSRYIRVYLTENNSDVLVGDNIINNFSDLENSSRFENGKVLLTRTVKGDSINNYRLRLWLSEQYEVSDKSEIFKCKVAVSTYKG